MPDIGPQFESPGEKKDNPEKADRDTGTAGDVPESVKEGKAVEEKNRKEAVEKESVTVEGSEESMREELKTILTEKAIKYTNKVEEIQEVLFNREEEKENNSLSVLRNVRESNPEIIELVSKHQEDVSIKVNDEGRIESGGHTYEDTPRMRSLAKAAQAIRTSLPEVPEGHVRLWRGNRKTEVGFNPSYTSSLEAIALPFLSQYRGYLTYVDVPEEIAKESLQEGLVADNAEFIIPEKFAEKARVVGVSQERQEEIKEQSSGIDSSSESSEPFTFTA
jgi:hypothetical protein